MPTPDPKLASATQAPAASAPAVVDGLADKAKQIGTRVEHKAKQLFDDADHATGGELGKNKFGILGALLFGVLGFMMGGPIWGILAALLGGGTLNVMQDGPNSFVGGLKEKIAPSQTRAEFIGELAKSKLAVKIADGLDVNHNGVIEPSECAGVQEAVKKEDLIKRIQGDSNLQEAIASAVDINGDGKVSTFEASNVIPERFAAAFTPAVNQPKPTPAPGK